MHPLIAKWVEADRHYDEVVDAAEAARHAAWEAAMEAQPDRARLRPATPADVCVGAILWYHHTDDGEGPGGSYSWMRVDVANDPVGGAFQSDGANHPYLDHIFVEDETLVQAA